MPHSSNRLPALVVAALSSFLTPFTVSSVTVALPSIGKDFGMDAVTLSWVATAYLLSAAIFLLPFGRLADLYGRKRLFAIGISLYALTSLLITLTPSAAALIALRVIEGMGAAMMFATSMAILTSVFPPGERGKMLGISVAAVYVGLSAGPLLGGFLANQFGWRSIFWVNVPLGIVVIVFVLWRLKGEWAEARGERFDGVGSVLLGLALSALIFGFTKLPALYAAGLIVLGLAGLFTFARWEARSASPVLNVRAFRGNTPFIFSNLAALINYSATFSVTFLLSLYLQYIKGLNPQQAGMVLIAQPIMMAVFSPVAGRLSDKIEPRVVASIGMTLTTIGLAMFIFLGSATGEVYVVLSLLILGLGFALFSSPNTNAVMSSVDRKYYGVASATVGTMRLVGQMLSMGISTLLFEVVIGHVQITPDYYPQFLSAVKTGFGLSAALCLAGIFISLARGNVRS